MLYAFYVFLCRWISKKRRAFLRIIGDRKSFGNEYSFVNKYSKYFNVLKHIDFCIRVYLYSRLFQIKCFVSDWMFKSWRQVYIFDIWEVKGNMSLI